MGNEGNLKGKARTVHCNPNVTNVYHGWCSTCVKRIRFTIVNRNSKYENSCRGVVAVVDASSKDAASKTPNYPTPRAHSLQSGLHMEVFSGFSGEVISKHPPSCHRRINQGVQPQVDATPASVVLCGSVYR